MLMRIGALMCLLAAVAILACGGGQPATTPEMVREVPPAAGGEGAAVASSGPDGSQAASELVVPEVPATAGADGTTVALTHSDSLDSFQAAPELVSEVPPCTPIEGASVDPCEGGSPLATAGGEQTQLPFRAGQREVLPGRRVVGCNDSASGREGHLHAQYGALPG